MTGLIGTSLTSLNDSILLFWFLGNDIAYIVIFPQLVCVLFFSISNGYGAVIGLLVGVLLKLLIGDPLLSIPPVIHFLGCTLDDGIYVQYAPVKSISMLTSFTAILFFSYLTSMLFNKKLLPQRWDVLKVRVQKASTALTPLKATRKDEKEQMDVLTTTCH